MKNTWKEPMQVGRCDMIRGEYSQMKCNQGQRKMQNAAQIETVNALGQGSKTCAEDKGNIKLEKGGPR
jgi:hypothetical protein